MITKQQLGNTLWGMAEILYDKVEDNKTYFLSLLFFKRLKLTPVDCGRQSNLVDPAEIDIDRHKLDAARAIHDAHEHTGHRAASTDS